MKHSIDFTEELKEAGCDCSTQFAAYVDTFDLSFAEMFKAHIFNLFTHATDCSYRKKVQETSEVQGTAEAKTS